MNEHLIYGFSGLCGVVFALGGTGFKPARWAGIGILVGLSLYLTGVSNWWIYGLGQSVAILTAPSYGERMKKKLGSVWIWPMRWFTYLVWTIPSMFLGVSIWVLLAPSVWVGLFYASNEDALAETFPWKVVEIVAGVMLAFVWVVACSFSLGGF